MDRRSHARGPSNFPVGGTPDTGIDEDDGPEIGSVFVPGIKKQNLNHLLNFMYPSRRGGDRRGFQPRRQGLQHVFHRHDHDLYLRAYCQFVVKEDGDYKANLLDPDVPIKWDQIEEIVVRSTGPNRRSRVLSENRPFGERYFGIPYVAASQMPCMKNIPRYYYFQL